MDGEAFRSVVARRADRADIGEALVDLDDRAGRRRGGRAVAKELAVLCLFGIFTVISSLLGHSFCRHHRAARSARPGARTTIPTTRVPTTAGRASPTRRSSIFRRPQVRALPAGIAGLFRPGEGALRLIIHAPVHQHESIGGGEPLSVGVNSDAPRSRRRDGDVLKTQIVDAIGALDVNARNVESWMSRS